MIIGHFCDADGVNLFYGTIQELKNHFQAEHFLCDDSECSEEGMMIAFRTEIDLKAHRASAHSKNLSKQQVRQTRTLDIDFSYGNRGRNDTHGHGQRNNRDTQREFDEYQENHQTHQAQASAIDTSNKEDFPALSSNNKPIMQLTSSVKHVQIYGSRLSKTDENFPQLPSSGKSSNHANNHQSKNNNIGKIPSSSSLFKQSAPKPAQAAFGKAKKNNIDNRPKESVAPFKDDFPALGPASGPQSFTARPIVRAAPKSKPQASKTVSNDQKSKMKFQSVSQQKKKVDLDDDDQSFPSLTPVPVGFTVKKSNFKFDPLVDNYSMPLSMSSKIQTIVRSEDSIPKDDQKKSAPNISSADNFPSLNGESSFSTGPQMWVTKGISNTPQTKMIAVSKPKVKDKNHVNKQNQKFNNKSKIQQLSYISMANSEARNETLNDTIMRVVNNNEMLQEFRNVSRLFVDGDYFPKSYYETCQHILSDRFEEIFPELLVLLPSIERQQVRTQFHQIRLKFKILIKLIFMLFVSSDNEQQELLSIHRDHMQIKEKSGAKPKMKSERELVDCQKCKQVLLQVDLLPHIHQHG